MILIILISFISIKDNFQCKYVEPEYETEVVDFGGLEDEQCLNQN